MLYESVIEVDERPARRRHRGAGAGSRCGAGPTARRAGGRDQGGVAIAFMHAYRYPAHEQRVAELARRLGFPQVSASHEVLSAHQARLPRRYDRGGPPICRRSCGRYVAQVAGELGSPARFAPSPTLPPHAGRGSPLWAKGSDLGPKPSPHVHDIGRRADGGGVVSKARMRSCRGPAGGVVGMAETGRGGGDLTTSSAFDMGGTSHRRVAFRRRIRARPSRPRSRGPCACAHP